MKKGLLTRTLLSLMILSAGGSHAQDRTLDQDIAHKEEHLQTLRARIDDCRREQSRMHGTESTLLDSIRRADEELHLLQQLVESLAAGQQDLERDIEVLRGNMLRARERLEISRQRLAGRLRTMYKQGRSRQLEILLTAASPVDLFRRFKYLAAASYADTHLMEEVRREQTQLNTLHATVQEKLEENRRLSAEKRREEGRTAELNTRRRRQVTDVRNRLQTSEQTMEALKREAEDLEMIITKLEEQRLRQAARPRQQEGQLTYVDFDRYKGSLPWPARGRILHSFGPQKHPVFHTTTINKGIDIQAPHGSEVVAVATGDVILIDWLRGYGKFIILDHHGGFYTLYAHTSEILVAEGDGIQGGEPIARVGETGSLEGPMLHFEIRRGRQELDPAGWLARE